MADFILSKDTLDNYLKEGNDLQLIVDKALETVESGSRVIIQNEFTNSPPEIIKTINSIGELNKWITNLLS